MGCVIWTPQAYLFTDLRNRFQQRSFCTTRSGYLCERFVVLNMAAVFYSVSVVKTIQLMLYREIMAVCSEIHTKYINTVCGQNVELLNVKLAVHIVTTGL